ncbi:MAG: hypothetical protein HZT40_15195 [Candidatus Thiothrix singaporensis]|uniref:Transposase n=1 Tax=Candidatus Thiothrix singaporensis TaxID=2799669 RepID=A0A7L6AUR7_9GAMM|nr:MAG: hypothetical protein HZT40_15195 [Candidatus Thiothrix singaporensis]
MSHRNLIERLWGFFKRKVIYGIYYETFAEFKRAALDFSTPLGAIMTF